ncbi:MAG: SDR family NAD(P)-dependent oxidoreductase [Selenomonadaceae bacterium]|nr:SDR family NAD(P)-dependent oxidoreductase [Selenomonadaceae bacterium]
MLIAIITGASSGLGREYVHALDREGMDEIWVIARRKERLQELAEKTITPLRILACDLTEPAVLHAISAELEKNHPIVNYLINAAGFGKIGSFADIPTEEVCAMIDLNCRAAVALTQMSIPYMPPTGGILNICSCAAFQPIPFLNVYAASKAFLLHYTRALHAELLPKGIHVTALCPYWIESTEFIPHAKDSKNSSYIEKFPFPQDIALVIRRSLKGLEKNTEVVTPGIIPSLHRMLAGLLPHSLMMRASARFHAIK